MHKCMNSTFPSGVCYNGFHWPFTGSVVFPYMSFPPYAGFRVGEAKNLGPLSITGLNVQSLSAFVSDRRVLSSTANVCVFSETAATADVLDGARKLLHSKGQRMVATEACPKRSFSESHLMAVSAWLKALLKGWQL